MSQHERGDFAAAERTYQAVLAADPSHYGAHHNLGVIYAAQHRWKDAEAAYRRALGARPGETATWQNLITTLLDAQRTDAALAEARRFVTVADTMHARRLLGRALLANGDHQEACRELVAALAFESRNSAVQLELAACFSEASDYDAALMHANAVAAREPANQTAAELLAAIRVQRRGATWGWLPVIVAVGALLGAIGARGPDGWARRRVAIGVFSFAVVFLLWLFTDEIVWLAGGLWGTYQLYAAFEHRRTRTARSQDRDAFLNAAGTVLGCVALADGEIQPAEWRVIRESYERAGFDDGDLAIVGAAVRRCAADFHSVLFAHEALYATLRAACTEFARRSNEPMRLDLFRTAVHVSLSDSVPTPGELSVTRACATWLNVPEDAQHEIWRQSGRDSAV